MSGYKCKFVHHLLSRHKCPECDLAMKNPMQTECGHLFCKECLEPLLNQQTPLCPLDKEPISRDGVFPDNACRREILNLDVYCTFSGCKWVGKLKDLEDHTAECEYSDVQCTMCGNHVQKRSLATHKKIDCPMRPELCVHCNKEVPFQQMTAHLTSVCPEVLRSCPNMCNPKLQMKLAQLEKHVSVNEGDCPLSTIQCPYNIFNCKFVSLRRDIEGHLKQYAVYHAQMQAAYISDLVKSFEQMRTAHQNQSERVLAIEQRSSEIDRKLGEIDRRLGLPTGREGRSDQHGGGRVSFLEKEISQLRTQFDQLQRVAASRGSFVNPATSDTHTMGPFSLGSATSAISGLPHAVPTLQQFEALSSKVTDLDHSLDRCLSSSLDQELRLQLLERATYNGILLWKIDDFTRRRREAVDGVTLSLYSTPFYTSRHGYKMCARVYLNGDGLGKGTHLSFFFVIMRGPFDALLTWPFKQKVMLTLLNQVGKKHVTDHFRPDPASSSFQRPGRKEMNIASGCPMFIRIEHLLSGGFIKDDSVFLRIVVDISDLPKIVP